MSEDPNTPVPPPGESPEPGPPVADGHGTPPSKKPKAAGPAVVPAQVSDPQAVAAPGPTPAGGSRVSVPPAPPWLRRVFTYSTPALLVLAVVLLVVGLFTRPVPPPAEVGRADVTRLSDKLDALDGRLSGFDARVESGAPTRTLVADATEKLSQVDARVTAVDTKLKGLDDLTTALNDPKDGLKKRVNDTAEGVKAADKRLDTLTQTTEMVKTAATEAKTAATDAKTAATEAKTAATEAKTAAGTAKDPPGLNAMKDKLGELVDKASGINQEVAILKSRVQSADVLLAQLVALRQQETAPTDVLLLAVHTEGLDVRPWVPVLAKALEREPARSLALNYRLAVMVVHDGEVQDGGPNRSPALLPWAEAKAPLPPFVTQMTTDNKKRVADLPKVTPADHFPPAPPPAPGVKPPARRVVLVVDPRDLPPADNKAWKDVTVDVLLITRDKLSEADEKKSKEGAAAWAEFVLARGGLVARVAAPADLSVAKGDPPVFAEVVRHLRRLTAAHR